MAEERRCQAPPLCVKNCGFFGSPATQDLCSKCYRDLQLKEHQSSSAKHALTQSLSSSSASASPSTSNSLLSPSDVDVPVSVSPSSAGVDVRGGVDVEDRVADNVVKVGKSGSNRCEACRKRVGLTGFSCRCGMVLCGTHRYPEQHGCGFDFKARGKEQIASANRVIKAPKLDKI